MFLAYEFRQFAQNPPYEHFQQRRRAGISQCALNHAPAERLLPVNFGLRRKANAQAERLESSPAMRHRVNPRVRRHAFQWEQDTVHVHDLELIYRLAVSNLRVE
jgi:hypothetical protein